LGEDAGGKAAPGRFPLEKPEPELVAAGLLAEGPFAAHAVEGGQHAGFEPWFGRDAGVAAGGVKLGEERGELQEHSIHLALDGAVGMVRRHGGIVRGTVRNPGGA
jgi:hypothetical protein